MPVYSAGSGIDISNGEISVVLDTDVFEIVESLPTQNISSKKIYLVSNGDTSGNNMYNEWHYLGHGAWEILGSKNVGINLRDYYTKTEIDAKGYLTSHQDITGKQNILTVGNGIDITNDVISCTLAVPESVSELTNDAGYISTETDPIYSASAAAGITSTDITNWNNKLSSFTETDPVYSASPAAEITSSDITNWNSKTNNLGTITGITMNNTNKGTSGVVDLGTVITAETDPIYSASPAAGITSSDISNWNSKTDNVGTITGITMNGSSKGTSGIVDLGTVITAETDPVYSASPAAGITSNDITNWNNKLSSFTETDPVYSASPAAGITSTDITNWNGKLTKAQADEYYVPYTYIGSLDDLTTAELNSIFS